MQLNVIEIESKKIYCYTSTHIGYTGTTDQFTEFCQNHILSSGSSVRVCYKNKNYSITAFAQHFLTSKQRKAIQHSLMLRAALDDPQKVDSRDIPNLFKIIIEQQNLLHYNVSSNQLASMQSLVQKASQDIATSKSCCILPFAHRRYARNCKMVQQIAYQTIPKLPRAATSIPPLSDLELVHRLLRSVWRANHMSTESCPDVDALSRAMSSVTSLEEPLESSTTPSNEARPDNITRADATTDE